MLLLTGLFSSLMAGFALTSFIMGEDTDDDEPEIRSNEFEAGSTQSVQSTIIGTQDDDALQGSFLDDEIFGSDGNDTIEGGIGRDLMDGGAGDDILRLEDGDLAIGGEGNDLFETAGAPAQGEAIPQILDFQIGQDMLVLEFEGDGSTSPEITFDEDSQPGKTLVMADGLATVVVEGVSGLGIEDIDLRFSDAPDDPIFGNVTNQYSSDAMNIRDAMAPQLDPEQGDALTGSFSEDVIQGSSGNDAIFGDEGDDTLSGLQGNDEIYGDQGNDSLSGGSGHDFLAGGEGDDSIQGNTGQDGLFGGDGNDTLDGGDGGDVLSGGLGADSIAGGAGNDLIDGTHAPDGGGDLDQGDRLDGGTGNDTILAGADDTVSGGEGADTFLSGAHIEQAEQASHILDFDPSEDQIQLLYDPIESPDPTIGVEDFTDGSGANILLNGQVVLKVTGAQGLSPSSISLRPINEAA